MPGSRNELNWFSTNLIDVLPAAVYVCNSAAVIVAYNKRATELWGRTPNLDDTDEKYCGHINFFVRMEAICPIPKRRWSACYERGPPLATKK
jgi:hypothetical protein